MREAEEMDNHHLPVHLRAAGVSLVVDRPAGLPRIAYWGPALGELTTAELTALIAAGVPQRVSNTPDVHVPVTVLPEQSAGWLGTPGLSGHRDGADFSAAFEPGDVRVDGNRMTVTATDPAARLGLLLELELTAAGLVRQRATLTNEGDMPYTLEALLPVFPVPAHATELLDMTGRHLRERSPQRAAFTAGTHLREGRRGRTGADATLVLAAGTRGFGFRGGEVWTAHVAWSGNHRTHAERTPQGDGVLGGGELLLPGEGRLAPGEAYASPWLYGSYGKGLDEAAARFHGHRAGTALFATSGSSGT
jgi:alpha-galactosidase